MSELLDLLQLAHLVVNLKLQRSLLGMVLRGSLLSLGLQLLDQVLLSPADAVGKVSQLAVLSLQLARAPGIVCAYRLA